MNIDTNVFTYAEFVLMIISMKKNACVIVCRHLYSYEIVCCMYCEIRVCSMFVVQWCT